MMAGEGHAVGRACRITGVSHAGYYIWRSDAVGTIPPAHVAARDHRSPPASKGTYGARHRPTPS